jgi:hypothetical protein
MPGDDVEKSLDADTSTSTSSSVPEPSRPGSAPNVLVREPFTVDVESRGCSHDAMANGGWYALYDVWVVLGDAYVTQINLFIGRRRAVGFGVDGQAAFELPLSG